MAEKSEAESTGSAPPAGGPHFLETEWVLWEHRAPDKSSKSYEDNMEKLVEFATVEDFWNAWNHIPPPSGIFYDGKTKKRFSNRIVESFSLFKKGIKPEWEDPANRAGAEWFCRRPFTPAQLVRHATLRAATLPSSSSSPPLCTSLQHTLQSKAVCLCGSCSGLRL